jgi:hypothetical protein
LLELDEKKTYVGAVAHLAAVIRAGVAFTGAKTKYLSPFLSRTDFGKYPDYVLKNPSFKANVITAGGVAGGARLMPNSPASAVTIDAWLDGIVAGKDPIDWGQDRKDVEKTKRWDPQAVGVPDDRGLGHVYEFRGLSVITPDQLVAFAKEYMGIVIRINHQLGKG